MAEVKFDFSESYEQVLRENHELRQRFCREIENSSLRFVPAGVYTCFVLDASTSEFEKGRTYVDVTLEIVFGKYKGAKIRDSLLIFGKREFDDANANDSQRFRQLVLCSGHERITSTNQLLHAVLEASVSESDGITGKTNAVNSYMRQRGGLVEGKGLND